MGEQRSLRGPGKRRRFFQAQFGCHPGREVPGEQGNVLAPLAKRRHVQHLERKPVEQVFLEAAAPGEGRQIGIGRADDPHVDARGPGAADPLEAAILDGPEDLLLGLDRDQPDLIEQQRASVGEWEDRARLAIDKGRDDLAREALREKKRFAEQAEAFRQEAAGCGEIVDQYKADIAAVEERLHAAREKHRLLAQRHIRARNHKQAQTTLRRAASADAVARFDQLENRIERMEAEASLVNHAVKTSLVEQLEALRGGDQIEKELEALKRERRRD